MAAKVLAATGDVEIVQTILGHLFLDHSKPYLTVDQPTIRRAFEVALAQASSRSIIRHCASILERSVGGRIVLKLNKHAIGFITLPRTDDFGVGIRRTEFIALAAEDTQRFGGGVLSSRRYVVGEVGIYQHLPSEHPAVMGINGARFQQLETHIGVFRQCTDTAAVEFVQHFIFGRH